MVKKIAENFNRLIRAHQRYRRQTDRHTTDGIAIACSERNVVTFAKNKWLDDRLLYLAIFLPDAAAAALPACTAFYVRHIITVSYTHLTLPTIYSV